jgi:hypothetical protein
MKKLVWVFGVLLLLSFVFPHLSKLTGGKPAQPTVTAVTDDTITGILQQATAADRARVAGIYSGLNYVINRPTFGQRVNTTEKWAELQASTLQLAVAEPGKYAGLDAAIEAVFLKEVGTDDVLPTNEATRKKLSAACEIIENSANAVK